VDLKLTHLFNDAVELSFRGQTLFRYVYEPTTIPFEGRKPHFHPLRTLAGNLLTNFRPHDHPWHHGFAMTLTHVSGQNFWGGATYVHEKGYVDLPNVGQSKHRGWDSMECVDGRVSMRERLEWITQAGQTWFQEQRGIEVSEVRPEQGYWVLDFSTRLKNVSGQELLIGSPTTSGRPMAGYGGLMWRGPRSWLHCKILGAEGMEGQDIMGKKSPWLAFSGANDETGNASTLLFMDQPGNPRYPNQWFLRNDPFAIASFAFMFDQKYPLADQAELAFKYRILVADGEWSREKIESYMKGTKG
jgi:hypothetical protein